MLTHAPASPLVDRVAREELVPSGVSDTLILVGLVYGLSELDADRKNVAAKPFAKSPSRGVPGDD